MLVILLYHPDSHKKQIHFHEQKKPEAAPSSELYSNEKYR